MLKNIIIVLICLINLPINAQLITKINGTKLPTTKRKIEFQKVTILNTKIELILDSFICYERENCNDNNDSSIILILSINNDKNNIFIDSGLIMSIESYNYSNFFSFINKKEIIGYFYHKKILCVLFIDNENYKNFFSLTQQKKAFKYLDYTNKYLKSNKRIFVNKEPFTAWYHNYNQGNFILIHKSSFCDEKN